MKLLIQNVYHTFKKIDNYKNIVLCFNGGKDCTVLIHLWISYLQQTFGTFQSYLQLLIINYDDTFDEIINFINQTIISIKPIHVYEINGNNGMKYALKLFKEQISHIDTCLIGTRLTDIGQTKLNIFQMTDNDWPTYLRVCPILNWTYSNVWNYIRHFNIPYCSLYDQGFTSLGKKSKTIKNPKLFNKNSQSYEPAFKLIDENYERDSRI